MAEGNAQENLLAWPSLERPSLHFGCTLIDMLGTQPSPAHLQVCSYLHAVPSFGMSKKGCMDFLIIKFGTPEPGLPVLPSGPLGAELLSRLLEDDQQPDAVAIMQELLEVYKGEQHILVWQARKGKVLLREDAQPRDALRPLWQVRMPRNGQ